MKDTVLIPNKQQISWNGDAFWVMDEPNCWKAYNLETLSLEDYFPELYEGPENAVDIPWDEVNREHVLQLQGVELTLYVHFITDDPEPFVPARLETASTEIGKHKGGAMVTHDGRRIRLLLCSVETTSTEDRQAFEAHEWARQELPTPASIESPADRLATDIRLLELERIVAGDFRELANKFTSSFPSLKYEELFAGTLHMKGVTWAEMVRQSGVTKATLKKRIDSFFRITKFPRVDRRSGMGGKKYRFDEARDHAPESDFDDEE